MSASRLKWKLICWRQCTTVVALSGEEIMIGVVVDVGTCLGIAWECGHHNGTRPMPLAWPTPSAEDWVSFSPRTWDDVWDAGNGDIRFENEADDIKRSFRMCGAPRTFPDVAHASDGYFSDTLSKSRSGSGEPTGATLSERVARFAQVAAQHRSRMAGSS